MHSCYYSPLTLAIFFMIYASRCEECLHMCHIRLKWCDSRFVTVTVWSRSAVYWEYFEAGELKATLPQSSPSMSVVSALLSQYREAACQRDSMQTLSSPRAVLDLRLSTVVQVHNKQWPSPSLCSVINGPSWWFCHVLIPQHHSWSPSQTELALVCFSISPLR